MKIDTSSHHTAALLKLAKKQVIIRLCEIEKLGIPRMSLIRLTNKGIFEKAGKGLYRLSNADYTEYETLAMVSAKVPQSVFCLLTALEIHQLTTQLPRDIWIAMPTGSHKPKIDYPPINMVIYSKETFTSGIETYTKNNITFQVYGVAKTIADCFKHRNKIGNDIAIAALKEAKEKSLVSNDELWHFAKICRVSNVMHPYIEALT
jgi:predicted transcriptional regulator of viral defense system